MLLVATVFTRVNLYILPFLFHILNMPTQMSPQGHPPWTDETHYLKLTHDHKAFLHSHYQGHKLSLVYLIDIASHLTKRSTKGSLHVFCKSCTLYPQYWVYSTQYTMIDILFIFIIKSLIFVHFHFLSTVTPLKYYYSYI